MFLLPYTSQHVFTEANKHNKANKSKNQKNTFFFSLPLTPTPKVQSMENLKSDFFPLTDTFVFPLNTLIGF